jgi:hypothetical protein
MRSPNRPERQTLRAKLLAAALGGFLLGGSILGVAPGAQAAVAAVPTATQLAGSAERAEELGEFMLPTRHRVRHHYRHHHHRRHYTHHRIHPAQSRAIARKLIHSPTQFSCFAHLIQHESGWDPRARNPSSGAYGIPQALPPRKLASAGADWRTNPRTQIRWAVRYIHSSYGSPCGAWTYWRHHHWY